MTDDELRHLRRCVELATEALEAGDEPFGSVLVAANLAPAERAAATVFTWGEHCPMCAAAYGWVGLAHRHVSSSEQLAAWVADLGVPRHRCGPSPSRRLSPSPGRWPNPRPRRSGPRPHPPLPWRILIGDVPGPPHRRHHHPRAGLATRPAQPDRVGPIVAAIVLCAWSHPGRCGSDAAFAMLGGAAPIPASSGQTVRVRLNRSGDRHSTKSSTPSS